MNDGIKVENIPETVMKELTDTEERLANAIAEKVRAAIATDTSRREKRFIHAVWEILQNVVAVVKRLQQ